jgi:chemotaxis protein CheD
MANNARFMAVQGDQETTKVCPAAPEIYYDRNFNTQAAKVLPGGYYVTARDMMIVTVLGSCVSACIRDPVNKIGGMNHFMLPEHSGEADDPMSSSARYGAYAMEILINNLLKMGADRRCLEAKLFGAGRVLAGVTDVGKRNARFALEYLQKENIRVAAQDLGNVYPRKVYYFPQSGLVKLKTLRNLHNDTIVQREREYRSCIDTLPITGEVELF